MYCIVATMRGHTQSILTLDILLEGKYIVTYGIHGEICVWDASTYAMLDGTYFNIAFFRCFLYLCYSPTTCGTLFLTPHSPHSYIFIIILFSLSSFTPILLFLLILLTHLFLLTRSTM